MFERFRRWLKFYPPHSLSWDGWKDFRKTFKQEAPIRYFLVEVLRFEIGLLLHIQESMWWVRHRTTNRYHIVRTGLEPGYHDPREVILHTNFTMLVDFVEVEKAWMNVVFDKEAQKQVLGWKRFLPRILRNRGFRSRDHGLDHLDWEISLGDESPTQAEAAQIMKNLYLWWTEERPKREEIPYPDSLIDHEPLSDKWKEKNPEQAEAFRQWAKEVNRQEQQWDHEDTTKLMELVSIRESLWT